MPVISKLVDLYRAQGIEICAGVPSHRYGGLPEANFTWFLKDGQSLTTGLGIAMQEVYALEHLFSAYQPKRVLIIGNSLGWSTLAVAMMLPQSRIVAFDAGYDASSLSGIDLTNRMAQAGGLPARALKGVSPQDVASIVDAELGGTVDFAFIDGLHTNTQVVLDYQEVRKKAAPDAVYLFHDVQLFDLYEGIGKIEALAGLKARHLLATPSGMSLLYDPAKHPALDATMRAFTPSERALAMLDRQRWSREHRHLNRWRRSIRKRWHRITGTSPAAAPQV